jgi:hypothetical protein
VVPDIFHILHSGKNLKFLLEKKKKLIVDQHLLFDTTACRNHISALQRTACKAAYQGACAGA